MSARVTRSAFSFEARVRAANACASPCDVDFRSWGTVITVDCSASFTKKNHRDIFIAKNDIAMNDRYVEKRVLSDIHGIMEKQRNRFMEDVS